MRTLLLFLGLGLTVIHAADTIATPAPTVAARIMVAPPTAGKTLWRVSLMSLAVTNALYVQSSWGKHELNSAMAGSSGTFGAQGALIKLGLQGGLVGAEYLLTRHPPG